MATAAKLPADPARGNWFAVAAFALIAAATQMLWLTYAPITTQAAAHYGVTEGAIGYLSIIFPLLYVVLAIPWGLVLDRWFRPALLLGGVLTAVGGIIRTVNADSFTFAMAGQIVCAAAQPLVLNSVAKLAAEYLPRQHRPAGIAAGSAGLFVGMLLSFVLGALFGDRIATLLVIEAVAAVGAAVLVGIALTRPGRFVDDVDVAAPESAADVSAHPLRASWSDPVIRLLIALIAVGNGVFVALTTWLEPFLQQAGVSATAADEMLITLVVAGIIGAATVPAAAAKRDVETSWMMAAIVGGALGCVALAALPSNVTGFVVTALMGFLILAVLPMVLDMVERRAGPAAATATGLVWLAGNAGGVVLTVIVGALLDAPAAGFLVLAAVMLVVGVPVVLGLRHRLRTA